MSVDNITVSDLEIMASARNYRNWMFRQIAPYVGERILEVGCGIGNFTSLLMDRELVVATDVYAPCVNYMKTRLGGSPKVIPIELDISDPAALELAGHEFDTVICLNVLEHVEDDLRALSHMQSVLRPGGRLVLLVPAFQFLYGTVDESLDHYRRYNRKTLLPRMRAAGFQVERSFYMNVIGMGGWFLNNRILKRREENAGQIEMFDRYIAPLAERVEKIIPPPFGLSLIAIGQKGYAD
jgi:ubiquinone/menaquinone biosynthesis C-methylase UbiE